MRALGDAAERDGDARGAAVLAEALDGVERELDLAAGVEAVAGEEPVAAREGREAGGAGELAGLRGDLGDVRDLAGDEEHGDAVDGADREARPGAMERDGDGDGGRVRVRRRGRRRRGAGQRTREIDLGGGERGGGPRSGGGDGGGGEPEEDEGAGAAALEEGGDLLLHPGAAEEAGGGVDGARRHDRRDEAPIDEGRAHPADGDERAVHEGRLFGAGEGAGAHLHRDAALFAAAQPPADAVVAERGREPRGDVGVDQLVALVADALGAPQLELPHRLEAELVDAAVARLDAEAVGRRHLAAPDGEGGRLADPQRRRALGEGAQLGAGAGEGGRSPDDGASAGRGLGPLAAPSATASAGGWGLRALAAPSRDTSPGSVSDDRARSGSGSAASTAPRNSSADWKRWARLRAMARATMALTAAGTPGAREASGCGSRWQMWMTRRAYEGSTKGGAPAMAS